MPAESYFAQFSTDHIQLLWWPHRGTGKALFKSGLPLWKRLFWTQLGLLSQLAVVHPAVNPSVKPTSLQKVETTRLFKASIPRERGTFISLHISQGWGKGRNFSEMSAAVKWKEIREDTGSSCLIPASLTSLSRARAAPLSGDGNIARN